MGLEQGLALLRAHCEHISASAPAFLPQMHQTQLGSSQPALLLPITDSTGQCFKDRAQALGSDTYGFLGSLYPSLPLLALGKSLNPSEPSFLLSKIGIINTYRRTIVIIKWDNIYKVLS